MSDAQRIRDDQGYLTTLGHDLGQQRMEQFVQGHGTVQAMALFLVMAVTTAPRADYSETALQVLVTDAEDFRQAANGWADSCMDLAEAWRRQRLLDEKGRRTSSASSRRDGAGSAAAASTPAGHRTPDPHPPPSPAS